LIWFEFCLTHISRSLGAFKVDCAAIAINSLGDRRN